MVAIVKALEEAVDAAATLSEADQEQIGRELLAHIEKLRQLRRDLDEGMRSLNAGEGRIFDVEAFLAEHRAKHGRA